MQPKLKLCTNFVVTLLLIAAIPASAKLVEEGYDYGPAMKKVAAKFKGTPGVVLHLGDSITYANPYSQWARYGKGKTEQDKAICRWMHVGEKNDKDGWHLCSVDRPRGRSETAASGIRVDQYLQGNFRGLPSLEAVIKKYKPQMVVLMLGTNDASAGRKVQDFDADISKAIDIILSHGTIPILSTIPPHPGRRELAESYNKALRRIARDRKIPLIDFEKEILKRRPKDWNGTLLGKNDVHPTARRGGTTPASAPTEENLSNSGYLLRGWLSVQKIAEVKSKVLDARQE